MAKKENDNLKDITDMLENGLHNFLEGNTYRNYLNVMSRFHSYSTKNNMLIALQKPDATYVAGYSSWKRNFDRQVKKGEKGIRIIAPSPRKVYKDVVVIDPNTYEVVKDADGTPVKERVEGIIQSYRTATVFDISQTEGKALPMLVTPLQGDVEEYDRLFSILREIAPVPIRLCDIPGSSNGYYHVEEKYIAVQHDMSQTQTLKTVIHEMSHALLHDKDTGRVKEHFNDRNTREIEAESVAYVVCQYLGIDTADYTFGYIASWSTGKELKELMASLEIIRATATELINGIETRMKECVRKMEQEKENVPEQGVLSREPEEELALCERPRREPEIRHHHRGR